MIRMLALMYASMLLAGGVVTSPPQTYTITGTVVDEMGQPAVGATVAVASTPLGVQTDLGGKFTLTTADSCVTLEVRFTGYEVFRQKNACAGNPVRITLTPSEVQLDEIIVMGEKPAKSRKYDRAIMTTAPRQSYVPAPPPPPGYYDPGTPHNTEDYALIEENRFRRPQDAPLSTFSIDVDAASYSNMRRFLRNGQLPPKDAVRIEELINYFPYNYPQPGGKDPFAVYTELSVCPWQPEHQLLHIGLQGKKIDAAELPPANLVFLLDVSGSMDAPNKLPLLKASLKLLADQLRPQDRVAIVVYAGSAGLVLPPTQGDRSREIKDALERLNAGGSTAGGAGIQLAYKTARENFVKGGNNRIILATDGDFNVGTSSDGELVRMIEKERESGVFLTVLGFGMGNYQDAKMQQLADKGNGNHYYIDDISEAKKVLIETFGGTLYTIAKDVKIQIEFNPAYVAGYRLVGYENRLLNDEDFNDDRKDAGELGAGHTVTALYEIIPAGTKSEFLASVDPLKYQAQEPAKAIQSNGEMSTIKLRYKEPDGQVSKLLTQTIGAAPKPVAKSSENLRWAGALAMFGMLLRESEYLGQASFKACLDLARSAQGNDPQGYRRECLDLMDTAMRLKD